MIKLEESVKKENANIIIGSVVCSAVVSVVMTVFCGFDYTIYLGALWAVVITEVNFFLMSVAVQKAVDGNDELAAKQQIQKSYMLRMGIYIALFAVGIIVPFINWIPVLLSVFYIRIIVTVRGLILNAKLKKNPETPDPAKVITDDEDEEEDEFEKAVSHFGSKSEDRMKQDAPELFGDKTDGEKAKDDTDSKAE